MANKRGFTLMELLVVLLIIGILSTVAIRTIDATRDRALFDQTAGEMKQLVHAVVGNPDYVADGRRIDFGFFGDMGRLPTNLRELVEYSGPGNWRGPYVRRGFTGDSVGYLQDAWGNPYSYDQNTGIITTIGNGKFPMTVQVADTLPQLYNNSIVGHVTDAENNPPGGGTPISITLYLSGGDVYPNVAAPGGHYEFSPANSMPVPIGIHRLVARYGVTTDTISRWVTVAQRTRGVIDFRFSRPFRSLLRMVGLPRIPPGVPDSSGFEFDLVSNHVESFTIDSIVLAHVSDTIYFRTLFIDGAEHVPYYPRPDGSLIGPGETAPVSPGVVIAPELTQRVIFGFFGFATTRVGTAPVNVHGKTFRFRFSDGSEITVNP